VKVRVLPEAPDLIPMKKYFQKINFTLPPVDMDRIRTDILTEGYAETFRSYEIADKDYFYELYSKKIKFNIPPDIVNYTCISDHGTSPHVDIVKTVINYYIDPANCVTVFWELRDVNYRPSSTPQMQVDGSWQESRVLSYHRDQLRLASYLRALPNEAYVLSTKDIHSVVKPQFNTKRDFFRWMWFDLTIDEVLENIILIDD
jgi:hypothetical protein